jgi:hypothetical protein
MSTSAWCSHDLPMTEGKATAHSRSYSRLDVQAPVGQCFSNAMADKLSDEGGRKIELHCCLEDGLLL